MRTLESRILRKASVRFGEGRTEKCPQRQLAGRLLDIVMGFEHQGEARRFLADLRQRMEKFALALHPDKTRLSEFGRYAAERRTRRGPGPPETCNFLRFTHIAGP